MAEQDAVDRAGTPAEKHLYVVLDGEQRAAEAEGAMASEGVAAVRMADERHRQALSEPVEGGVLGTVGRLLKRIGGESNEAERYAGYLDQGKIVLAVPAADRETAVRLSDLLAGHDAYDMTYFSGWSIEYFHPEANERRGIPTHAITNTGD